MGKVSWREVQEVHPSEATKVAQTTCQQQKRDTVEETGSKAVKDRRPKVLEWHPEMVLNGAPHSSNASIREFCKGKARYLVDFIGQALLLPKDMEELRNFKKHEIFLSIKRDLAMVRTWLIVQLPYYLVYGFVLHLRLFLLQAHQALYVVEEQVNQAWAQAKEEESRK